MSIDASTHRQGRFTFRLQQGHDFQVSAEGRALAALPFDQVDEAMVGTPRYIERLATDVVRLCGPNAQVKRSRVVAWLVNWQRDNYPKVA
jgi:hypothetical protein